MTELISKDIVDLQDIEKVQFLQSLPYFDKITKNSVGKISL